jgi:hypothetical protein
MMLQYCCLPRHQVACIFVRRYPSSTMPAFYEYATGTTQPNQQGIERLRPISVFSSAGLQSAAKC